jgi:hypothetical protein
MTQVRKRATIRQVAEATGLSTAAVSYALRGLHVSEETPRRVEQAAADLSYEADPIARALASGRTEMVGLLCGSLVGEVGGAGPAQSCEAYSWLDVLSVSSVPKKACLDMSAE